MSDILWRLIEIQSYSAAMNMALHQAIAETVSKGLSSPTIIFSQWKDEEYNGGISVGYKQTLDDLDLEKCEKARVPITRRPSSGNILYHREDITYAIIIPRTLFPKDFLEDQKQIYSTVCGFVVNALNDLFKDNSLPHVKAVYVGLNDVVIKDGKSDKKICGSAIFEYKNAIVQHGSIFFKHNGKIIPSLVKEVSHEDIEKNMDFLEDYIKFELAYEALKKSFCSNDLVKKAKPGKISELEWKIANKLVEESYGNQEFITGRSLQLEGIKLKSKGFCGTDINYKN